MRLYRLVAVERHGWSAYREHGQVHQVRAKHARQARRLVADACQAKGGKLNRWLNSSMTRCTPVPHAPVKGKRAGMVTR